MTLGDNLKYYREKAKMEIKDVAKKAKVKESSYKLWENDDALPDLKTIAFLAFALHCSPYDLVFGVFEEWYFEQAKPYDDGYCEYGWYENDSKVVAIAEFAKGYEKAWDDCRHKIRELFYYQHPNNRSSRMMF